MTQSDVLIDSTSDATNCAVNNGTEIITMSSGESNNELNEHTDNANTSQNDSENETNQIVNYPLQTPWTFWFDK